MAGFGAGAPLRPLYWQYGADTDIGGGRENQDDYFVWSSPDLTILVLCVLDGHGREVGRIAAATARASLREYFDAHHAALRMNPYECLVTAHEIAHAKIKVGFRQELEKEGYEIEESPEGYLLKRMPPSQTWGCVHGGSSCSIVAIVDYCVYVANVGDSSGTLSTTLPVLTSKLIKHIGDAASLPGAGLVVAGGVDGAAVREASSSSSSSSSSGSSSSSSSSGAPCEGGSAGESMSVDAGSVQVSQDNLVITAEHSPESISEFCRLRAYRCKPGDARLPALAVVYDSPSADKTRCSPVFSLDDDGVPTLLNKGKYYKNVRKEWASLVSTPSTARFQDALAFTRSLGDLHLHTFGVTHLPEVQMLDLREVFGSVEEAAAAAAAHTRIPDARTPVSDANAAEGPPSISMDSVGAPPAQTGIPHAPAVACIVLATDGVWDNWAYEDVTRFVMDASCLNAINSGPDGAERVAKAFMQRNTVYAKRNFGGQADNATGIVLYVSASPALPHQPLKSS